MSAQNKEWGNGSNVCDWSHDTKSEIRRLPTGGGAAILVCRKHFDAEMKYRRERNQEEHRVKIQWEGLGTDFPVLRHDERNAFEIVSWYDLEIVQAAEK